VGTVVPLPQIGNLRPRLFRIPEAQALINRFGFNSDGMEEVLARVRLYEEQTRGTRAVPLGVNVGKNKNTEDLAQDYIAGVKAFAPYADFLTINVSSPNTPGLRDLQRRKPLEDLLLACIKARASTGRSCPLFVKIAPDQTEDQMQDIAEVSLACGIDGIIIGNTTMSRPLNISETMAREAGGLSGKPLFTMSTKVLSDMYRLTNGKIPLIGCGGIFDGRDVYTKIRSGASFVQIYTALIYEGPYIVAKMLRELELLLKRDGFANVSDAVGADLR
jgi:dihydroorotate dehydrogenase